MIRSVNTSLNLTNLLGLSLSLKLKINPQRILVVLKNLLFQRRYLFWIIKAFQFILSLAWLSVYWPIYTISSLLYQFLKIFLPKTRKSEPFSCLFRRIFENKKTQRIIGVNLAISLLLLNFIKPSSAPLGKEATLSASLPEPEQEVITKPGLQIPTQGYISQGYHWYHKAVDIANEKGTLIYPIAAGKITQITSEFWGFGNYLIIAHEDGFSSLYAHLDKIKVKEGEKVDKETIIGEMGSSGFSTGPHLHLEIWEDGKVLNPFVVLEKLAGI